MGTELLVCRCVDCVDGCSATAHPPQGMTVAERVAEHWLCRTCLQSQHRSTGAVQDTKAAPWTRPRSFPMAAATANDDWYRQRDEQAAHEAARQIRAEQLDQWRERIGGRFERAAFDEYADSASLEDIRQFLGAVSDRRAAGINLVLSGNPGVGKSWIMWAVANTLAEAWVIPPRQIVVGTEEELLTKMTSRLASERDKARSLLLDRHRVRLIAIDEVGRANYHAADDRRYAWDQVADYAYRHDIPIVVATNLVPTTPAPGARVEGQRSEAAEPNPFGQPTQEVARVGSAPAPKDWGKTAGAGTGQAGHPTEVDSSHFMSAWMGDAAYNRIVSNTPSGEATIVRGGNRRRKVNEGAVTRAPQEANGRIDWVALGLPALADPMSQVR